MAFFQYVLLALLGSAGAATPGVTPADPSTRTVNADAISQPRGGTAAEGDFNEGIGLLGQATGGSTDRQAGTGRKGRRHVEARRRHRRHRHRRVTTGGKKPSKV